MTTLSSFYHNIDKEMLGADLSSVAKVLSKEPLAIIGDDYKIILHPVRNKIQLNLQLNRNWSQRVVIPITNMDMAEVAYHVNTTLNIGVKI